MRRTLVLFLTLVLLWLAVTQLNHSLSARHIHVWIGGLFLVHGALALSLRSGLGAALLAGALWDATTPVAFGTHLLLFATAHVVLFHLRDRVPRDETVAQVVIALLANLALFLAFSFLQVSHLPQPAAVWPRIIFDLICSQVVIALVAPWFLALQDRALVLARPLTESYVREYD